MSGMKDVSFVHFAADAVGVEGVAFPVNYVRASAECCFKGYRLERG